MRGGKGIKAEFINVIKKNHIQAPLEDSVTSKTISEHDCTLYTTLVIYVIMWSSRIFTLQSGTNLPILVRSVSGYVEFGRLSG